MATIYVATDGDNGNGGTDPVTDAKLTLASAISAAADGDTIEMVAGTYANQTWLQAVICGGKNLVVKPYQGGAVTLSNAGGTEYTLLGKAEANDGHIEFQDLTINGGASSRAYPVYMLAELSLSFTRCTFTIKDGEQQAVYCISGINDANRTITLTDCLVTMPPGGAGRNVIASIDGNVSISGGTFTMNCANYPIVAIATSGAFGTCEIDGLTSVGTCQNVVGEVSGSSTSDGVVIVKNCDIADLNGLPFDLSTIDSLYCVDNTLAADASDATRTTYLAGFAIAAGGYIVFKNNICTDWAGGCSLLSDCDIEFCFNNITVTADNPYPLLGFGQDDWGTEAPETTVLGSLKRTTHCIGNDVSCTGAGNRHAGFLGMGYAAIGFHFNKVVNRGSDNLQGLVIKASGAHVSWNVIDAYKAVCYISGGTGNTVHNNTFNQVSDGGSLLFSNGNRSPEGNRVFNNVFGFEDASARAVDFQTLNDTYNNFLDYNMFGVERFAFNGNTYASLALLEAGEANFVTRGGGKMLDNCLFEDPAINITNYRVGNRKAYVSGYSPPHWPVGVMGASLARRTARHTLLLP